MFYRSTAHDAVTVDCVFALLQGGQDAFAEILRATSKDGGCGHESTLSHRIISCYMADYLLVPCSLLITKTLSRPFHIIFGGEFINYFSLRA
jgi:hypothetical protein